MASINLTPLLMPRITSLDATSLLGRQGSFPGLLSAAPLPATDALPAGPAALGAPPAASTESSLAEVSSMRPDQLFMMRQLVWPQLNRTALASAWRSMVHARLALLAQPEKLQAQGSLQPGAPLAGPQAAVSQQMEWHPDAWRFVISRPDQQITLRVVDSGPDQPSRRRRRGRAALRVELTLADGSSVMIQLEALEDDVIMQLAAPHPKAMDHVRATLPRLREAITRAGLKLATVDVGLVLAPARPLRHAPAFVSGALPAPLFSAMADLVMLLTAPA